VAILRGINTKNRLFFAIIQIQMIRQGYLRKRWIQVGGCGFEGDISTGMTYLGLETGTIRNGFFIGLAYQFKFILLFVHKKDGPKSIFFLMQKHIGIGRKYHGHSIMA